MNARQKTTALFAAKLLVTILFLWWLSGYFNFQEIRGALSGVNPVVIIAGIVLHVLSYLIGAVRWWRLFQHLTKAIAFRSILPSYYLGVFFNNILPSSIGGDLARSVKLYSAGMSGSALVGSALVDRMLGFSAIIVIGIVALFISAESAVNQYAWPVVGISSMVLLAVALVLVIPDWSRKLDRSVGGRWRRLHAVLSCFPRYRRAPLLLLGGFLLSLLGQVIVVSVFVLFANELQIDIPLFQLVAVLTLVFLVQTLPISLGGLGPREGTMMALLLPFGVEPHAVLALSVLYLVALWTSSLPGAYVVLFPHGKDTRTVEVG